ncbi:MAG: radical SAM family heme chaperone HemW [Gemmatimonadota bacterium]|nr:radical SAM family heme chaperone HemW [Gemmatimonadota bacterium]
MHLYFHVPFCARRCSYCDFAIAVRRETPSAAYRDAVAKEWRSWRADPIWEGSPEVRTIYFGGGTPSRLDPDMIAALVHQVRADRPVAMDVEITLETNPDDVTPENARGWVAAGINRISLGVQSFDPAVLAWMHREHTVAQVASAIAALRESGIQNLSLDLIYAVPSELGRDWSGDLFHALAFKPEHLSLYGLTIEPGTPLFRWTRRGEAIPAPDDRAATEYLQAQEQLARAGYQAYEVSNAARPGFHSRHNSAYWQGATFLGLGPSAHGGTRGSRWWNVREWAEYARRIEDGQPVLEGRETLDSTAQRLEGLYLGLRTSVGVPVDWIPPGTSQAWVQEGWAILEAGAIRLTPQGWLRLDALVSAVPDP